MKMTYGTGRRAVAASCVSAAILVSGCAGPSTRILPRESGDAPVMFLDEGSEMEEVNPYYLKEELDILTASVRCSGSWGESDAARYLAQLLSDYGYEVERQRFRYENEDGTFVTGTNVEAVRRGALQDSDILILTTHHDTAAGSPGGNDNASGVVAWLETARLVSRLDTDTELRFVSVSGSENAMIGARHYVDSLTGKERSRVIGCLEIGPLASQSENRILLGTADGKETMLGDLLKRAGHESLAETWPYEFKQGAHYLAFYRAQIPSVYIGQPRAAYEAGTPLDTAETVDIERIAQIVNVLSRTVSDIMDDGTPSMLAKSRYMNDLRDDAYYRSRDEELGFGQTEEEIAERLGMTGRKKKDATDPQGQRAGRMEYRMKWFDVDQTILTDYYYREGKLSMILPDGAGAGVEFGEMKERLTSWYGVPHAADEGPNGIQWEWNDPIHRVHAKLIPERDGYQTELYPFEPEMETIGTFSPGGQAEGNAGYLLGRAGCFFPETFQEKPVRITLYTDGIGGTRGYLGEPSLSADDGQDQKKTAAGTEEENREQTAAGNDGADASDAWEIFLDVEDALTDSGGWRDETATDLLLAGLYGELLERADPDGIADGFVARFPDKSKEEAADRVETGVKPGDDFSYAERLPDFSESFALFVLTGEVKEPGGEWNGRRMYFYGNEELLEYRDSVREKLHLSR